MTVSLGRLQMVDTTCKGIPFYLHYLASLRHQAWFKYCQSVKSFILALCSRDSYNTITISNLLTQQYIEGTTMCSGRWGIGCGGEMALRWGRKR